MTTDFLERYRPEGFEGILGQDTLISVLAERVRTKDHSRHIVLHGAEGSGKMTVARLYARAMQCVAPTPTGSPCQHCTICEAMKPEGSLGYFEMDVRELSGKQHASYLVQSAYGFMLGDRATIVVNNADAFTNDAATAMLKILEKESLPTTYIFVVNEITKLHPAIRSRCQAFRLKPLERADAFDRLETVCRDENIVYEKSALDVIVDISGAFAGISLRRLDEVASGGDVTFARAWQLLGADWGEAMLQCWRALLNHRRDEALELFESLGRDYMQSFVLTLYLRVSSATEVRVNPVLDLLPPEEWQFVIDGLSERARLKSMEIDEIGLRG